MAPPRNRRPGFSRRAQYGLFLGYVAAIGGALVGAVLLLLAQFDPPAYAAARGALREVTTPISSGLDWVRRGVGGIPGGISSYFGVRSENARLREQVKRSEEGMRRAATLDRENRRLRALLAIRDRTVEPVATARLVSSSSASTRRFATINAGRRDGVQAGQPVRGPEGLIGRVTEASPNTARLLLIVDPESIVPVRRVRDGLPAIAAGRGDGLIDIRSAGIANVRFDPGDVFVTSGAGGLFPPDVPVARVMRAGSDTAPARPFASPDSLDFALVQQAFLPAPPPAPAADEQGATP